VSGAGRNREPNRTDVPSGTDRDLPVAATVVERHPGTVDGCADCAAQLERQQRAARALRAHQRQARQQVDRILGRSS
jgi:hypothetical protein